MRKEPGAHQDLQDSKDFQGEVDSLVFLDLPGTEAPKVKVLQASPVTEASQDSLDRRARQVPLAPWDQVSSGP